jgi:acyl carrier protein
MNEESILKKIIHVFKETLNLSEEELLKSKKIVRDLGIDSIAVMSLSLQLSKVFKINVLEEDLRHLFTFEDIVYFIKHKIPRA